MEQPIQLVEKPFEKEDIEKALNPIVKNWFYSKFQSFSLPQLYAVPLIMQRKNVLISAPTGATKTLTAFLTILNELISLAEKSKLENKIYCLYVSPLKALNNDIAKNLIEPLKEMASLAGKELGIRVEVRTGDTPSAKKQKMLEFAPHILVTTPESLAIALSSKKFSSLLHDVEWCIVDEIHGLADNKRGVHLSLSLERLQRISPNMVRIGLSATIAPLEEVAKFLVGFENGKQRECLIVNVQFIKQYDLQVISPHKNLIEMPFALAHNSMYNLINSLIDAHGTTLIFTNTRSATERVVDNLKEKFQNKYNAENVAAHHGSLSAELRHLTEERLRSGLLKAVVSSTSLELGIDIGYIDLVLCLGSPKSIARFLQRAGRAGHKLHDKVKGRIIVMDRDDLVECAVLVKSSLEKKIDKISIPKNCLDVLAQHIVGLALERNWNKKELFDLIKRSYCYQDLAWRDFDEVLSYLSGEFAELKDRRIYAKIWNTNGEIAKRGKLTRAIYMQNIGTIPSESFVVVKCGDQILGMLDESFVENLKSGDAFVLGGEIYEFKYRRGMVVQVNANVKRPPNIPSWFSEMLPLSFDLALEIGKFRRLVFEKLRYGDKEIKNFIKDYLQCSDSIAEAILDYFEEQYRYCKQIPNDKLILIEHTVCDGKKKIVFHTIFGRRVNDCLSRAIAFVIGKLQHKNVEVGINDNGFYICSEGKISISSALNAINLENFEKILSASISKSEVFKRRFRHVAERALALIKKYKGVEKKVGRQELSSHFLLAILKRYNPKFFLIKEAKRECLEDLMSIEDAKKILKALKSDEIEIREIHTEFPSPFALNIVFQGYLDVLKIEDKAEFLKRAHQIILEKIK